MSRRPSHGRIWGGGFPPLYCDCCHKNQPIAYLSVIATNGRDHHATYLCARCFAEGTASVLVEVGLAAYNDPIIVALHVESDPMGPVNEEQTRKRRDWSN